jgi:hypothetical protein
MRSSASSEVVFAWIELISLVFLFGLLTVVESDAVGPLRHGSVFGHEVLSVCLFT